MSEKMVVLTSNANPKLGKMTIPEKDWKKMQVRTEKQYAPLSARYTLDEKATEALAQKSVTPDVVKKSVESAGKKLEDTPSREAVSKGGQSIKADSVNDNTKK